MRVLHVFKTYLTESYGGVEQLIFQLCKDTTARGIQNKILTLSKDRNQTMIEREEATVYRFKLDLYIASTGFSLSALKGFTRLVNEVDLVHYHFPWPFADLMHFATRVEKKKPTIVTYHSDIVKQKKLFLLYLPLMHKFLNSVDAIVATSPNYVTTSKVLQEYQSKIKVISPGYDKTIYPEPSAEKISYWKNKLGADFFLFIGALRYYKGVHFLLDAVKNTDLKLVIVGGGALEASLKELAQKNVLNNVVFLGALPEVDKIALLKLCYAFVFPSHLRSEAFGSVLVEASMYGKPLISAEIGTGSSYINIHNQTGLVVPPENPAALKTAMQKLRADNDLAKVMGVNAEKRYQHLFTSKKMTDDYMSLYTELYKKYNIFA